MPRRASYEYEFNKKPVCPHCDAEYDPDDPDPGMFQDDEVFEIICPDCSKTFACRTYISFDYSTAVDEESASNDEWGPKQVEPTTEQL